MAVKVTLSGGLGNQLFMQIAGMWLARKTNSRLETFFADLNDEFSDHGNRLRITSKGQKSAHKAFLGLARRKALQYEEILRYFSPKWTGVLLKSLREFVAIGPGYDPRIETLSGNICLHGYFQTWKMASEFTKPEILALLDVPHGSKIFDDLLQQAQASPPAILHFRRGDYKKLSKDLGLLSITYYEAALKQLDVEDTCDRPIWIFADDPKDVAKTFGTILPKSAVWISGSYNLTAAQELLLMSHGSAHVISNSTFAWWGAYLSEARIVIRPEKWFRGRTDPVDLLPAEWLSIPSQWEDHP